MLITGGGGGGDVGCLRALHRERLSRCGTGGQQQRTAGDRGHRQTGVCGDGR